MSQVAAPSPLPTKQPKRPDYFPTAGRMLKALNKGYDAFDKMRVVYKRASEERSGPWFADLVESWGNHNKRLRRPVSALTEVISLMHPNLTGHRMTTSLQARATALDAYTRVREAALDEEIERLQVAKTDRLVVLDCLMGGLGVEKTGVRAGKELVRIDGQMRDPGESYVVRVSPFDFAMDPVARCDEEVTFIADRYRVRKSEVLEAGFANEDVIRRIEPIQEGGRSKSGLANDPNDDNTLDDLIELWDVVFWRNGCTYEATLPPFGGDEVWVVEPREYGGLERGPYHRLILTDVPECMRGLSIPHQIMDLHLAISDAATKMVEQIVSLQRRYAYKGSSESTAKVLRQKWDEMFVRVDDPKAMQEVITGGLTSEAEVGMATLREMLNNAAINLQMTAGKEDNAGTATAATILQGNAQVILSDFRERCQTNRRGVVKDLSWLLDTLPDPNISYKQRTPGLGMVDMVFNADSRKGTYQDFLYKTDVTFAGNVDPTMAAAQWNMAKTTLPAWLTFIMQTGGDINSALSIESKKLQAPELLDIWPNGINANMQIAQMGMQGMPQSGGAQPRQTAGGKAIDETRSALAPSVPGQTQGIA